jgi:hypothetical protein
MSTDHLVTPFGVNIPVFRPSNSIDLVVRLEDVMTLAGVHGEANRSSCYRALIAAMGTGEFPAKILREHGACATPSVPLPRPMAAIYPRMPREAPFGDMIESWATLALEFPRWDTRADALVSVIGNGLDAVHGADTPVHVRALGMQHLLTAALEHLGEHAIERIEAAALYALAIHAEWRSASLSWLEPFRATWLADWTAVRPAYRRFAACCRAVNPVIPDWLVGPAGGAS